MVTISKVESEHEKMDFIKFPWIVYAGDSNWVPPLLFDVRNNLDPKKNPFFKHAETALFLAEKDGRLAGRIAAIKNDNHNRFHQDHAGFFGFFESINDKEVSNRLLETACKWCSDRGMETIIGPVNPSTNDECALLVDGFDSAPVTMMPYNPPYYVDMIEGFGFRKARDLYAYYLGKDVIDNQEVMAKLERVANIIKSRANIVTRNLNLSELTSEVRKIQEVYNDAWEYNWGFIPMTSDEFDYAAKNLKAIVDPDFVIFAEVDGQPVGFSLALPDINQVLKKLNGRLFPLGIFKLISGKKKIDMMRVVIMGVKKAFHVRGIDSVFYLETIKNGVRKGYKAAEISWVLEDNIPMRQTAENLGARIYKTYRIYHKNLI
jgi:hypothetical protein